MKIKKIKLEKNEFFDDLELNFTDSYGNIIDNIVFAGENGCGKTKLLNIIFEFTTFPLQGEVSEERRSFIVQLSTDELSIINDNLKEANKLVSPTGEMEILFNFSEASGNWTRIQIQYQSQDNAGNKQMKSIQTSTLISNETIKALFKSIFSTVEINYNPKETSTVTAKEVDEKVKTSIKSGNDLATEIQQLLIDIQANDANDLQNWVTEHVGQIPPANIINTRTNRFKSAFSNVFDNLNFCKIETKGNKKRALFQKNTNEINISDLSSGEKQIVFRGAFLLRNQQSIKGSVVLIDEPEISLHPLWQKKIYDYYRLLFRDSTRSQTSQIFFATHSQYVLSSALESGNTLIILFDTTGMGVTTKTITAPLILPTITAAELNYTAFDIVSDDYHIQLYGYLQNKIATSLGMAWCSVKKCDEYITLQTDYDASRHRKPSSHNSTTYDSLPTYIRNAIDHPSPTQIFSQTELKESIELLIKLCR